MDHDFIDYLWFCFDQCLHLVNLDHVLFSHLREIFQVRLDVVWRLIVQENVDDNLANLHLLLLVVMPVKQEIVV